MAKKNTPARKKHTTPKSTTESENQTYAVAGFLPRIAAIIYDTVVIAAVLLLAGAIALLITYGLSLAGYVDQQAFQTDAGLILSQSIVFQIYIWAVYIGFYVYFWTKGGQTLGMRAWRLRVQNHDNTDITATQALIRLSTAAFGLGNILVLFSRDNNAFQDLWAKTQVVRLTKEQNKFIKMKDVKLP